MSLVVAVPFGLAAAVTYGAATAVQHDVAHTGTGRADARGLLNLLRHPRWLLAVAGDAVGLVLHVIALATGPVVIIQPLLVLALPVSLGVGALLGRPRPDAGDLVACGAIIAALTVFFLLIGEPPAARALLPRDAVLVVVVALAAGGALCGLAVGRSAPLRAGVFGAVAGAWFGTVAVLLNAAATQFSRHGLHGLVTTPAGLVPVIGIAVVGLVATVLTQVSFQIGALGAALPANMSADPLTAVVLGAVLLGEELPVGSLRIVAYLVCLAVIVLSAIRLAAARGTPPPAADRIRHNGGR